MRVSFYLPEQYLPAGESRAQWERSDTPRLLESGKAACAQCWIWQTWLRVRDAGDFPLVRSIPSQGAFLTLSNCLPAGFRAREGQYAAAIVADFLPHPGAQLQIVQNRAHAARLPGAVFIPLWSQPGIVPRDFARGERFERVGFFGDPNNLAPELADPAWREMLKAKVGVELVLCRAERWHDYSDMDAVIGIRDFSGRKHVAKPATKLYNAWMGGVPFIGGSDSAFAAERRSELDYLEVRSREDVVNALVRLKENPRLREAMVANGKKRAVDFTPDAIAAIWLELLQQTLPAASKAWTRFGAFRKTLAWWKQRCVFVADRKLRR